jgi:hypothetical protein
LIFPPKTNAAKERLAGHLWAHRDDLFAFLHLPGLDATNWRAELAIRFGVILRKVWGGSRTWPGARAQSVLMSVWRTCWHQGRSALDFLSQLLRVTPVALALPPVTYRANIRSVNRRLGYRLPAGSTRQSNTAKRLASRRGKKVREMLFPLTLYRAVASVLSKPPGSGSRSLLEKFLLRQGPSPGITYYRGFTAVRGRVRRSAGSACAGRFMW